MTDRLAVALVFECGHSKSCNVRFLHYRAFIHSLYNLASKASTDPTVCHRHGTVPNAPREESNSPSSREEGIHTPSFRQRAFLVSLATRHSHFVRLDTGRQIPASGGAAASAGPFVRTEQDRRPAAFREEGGKHVLEDRRSCRQAACEEVKAAGILPLPPRCRLRYEPELHCCNGRGQVGRDRFAIRSRALSQHKHIDAIR